MEKNSKFKEYVTSSAFRVDLSHAQIQAMLALDISMMTMFMNCSSQILSYRALERRGIFYYQKGIKKDFSDRGYFFTEEGKLLCNLVKACGFVFIPKEVEEAA